MKLHHAIGLAALLALPAAQAAEDAAPAAVPAAQSQPMPGPAMDEDEMSGADLKLTDDQKMKLRAIQMEARAHHERIRAESQAKIKLVLTTEQYQKMQAFREQRLEEMKKRHQDGQAGKKDKEKKKEKMKSSN